MIVPDINILVYAYDSASPYHAAARAWWEQEVNAGGSIGLPWSVVTGFLRLVTHPRLFEQPYPIASALSIVSSWLQQPNVVPLDPGNQHWRLMNEFLLQVGLGGKLVDDAHLAAVVRGHKAELITNDRDFDRFSGLLTRNVV